jgi:hypothetical protein
MALRHGKIARLPHALRERLNRRLRNNESVPRLLAWLNADPTVRKILAADFHNSDVTSHNLCDWRYGGYVDWLTRRDRLVNTRELAKFAIRLAKAAGMHLSDAAAAIAAGQILEMLEGLQIEELSPEAAAQAVKSIESLRRGDHSAERLRIDHERLAQLKKQSEQQERKLKLLERKAQQADEAQAAAKAPLSPEEKERRYKEIFGITE